MSQYWQTSRLVSKRHNDNDSIIHNNNRKIKPRRVVSYRKYKDFHKETFLDPLRYELNSQGQFLNEKGLDTFSTICIEIFDKKAPKKGDTYDLTINLPLIMQF